MLRCGRAATFPITMVRMAMAAKNVIQRSEVGER